LLEVRIQSTLSAPAVVMGPCVRTDDQILSKVWQDAPSRHFSRNARIS